MATREPRRITPDYLDRAALAYLERFASSAANLRRLLMRRVSRAAAHYGSDPAEGAAWVEALIARYQRAGLLNDRLYAEARAASLHRRGGSTRRIRDALAAKGVATDDAAAALAALHADSAEPDLQAACALARRRRLGPWRPDDRRAAWRDKDLAALGRAGFSYDLASRVIDADSVAALEAELADADRR